MSMNHKSSEEEEMKEHGGSLKLDLFLSHSVLLDKTLNNRFIKILININEHIYESNTTKSS